VSGDLEVTPGLATSDRPEALAGRPHCFSPSRDELLDLVGIRISGQVEVGRGIGGPDDGVADRTTDQIDPVARGREALGQRRRGVDDRSESRGDHGPRVPPPGSLGSGVFDRIRRCTYGSSITGPAPRQPAPKESAPQQSERHGLCDLFLKKGADAPTLCEGWTAFDLAAHLYVREHRPIAAIGLVAGGPFARRLERVMKQTTASVGFEELVAKVRAGPPVVLRPFDKVMNLNEMFVHHEDLRRGGGDNTPRPAEEILQIENDLWTSLKRLGRMTARSLRPVGLDLVREDGETFQVVVGQPVATLRGRPGELALYLSGRKAAAQVEIEGPQEATEALRSTSFGI
jgi:uncharacterized protein (TIGR03085 family)